MYTQLHDEIGHLGIDRVFSLAREKIYWPRMEADLEHHVTKACRCLKQNSPVYEVVSKFGPKKRRILHRNYLLLPCQSLPIDTTPAELRKNQRTPHCDPLREVNNISCWYSQKNQIIQAVVKKMDFVSMIPSPAQRDEPEKL